VFQRPHDYGEILFDSVHMTHNGYTILTKHLFDAIIMLKSEKKAMQPYIPHDMTNYMNYLAMLKKKSSATGGVIGSVVMNCNPFTFGHKHLVVEARKRCDYLYIFVLDEDKSFFPFDDRITMAKIGLQDVTNVAIIPSGKTIISSVTMPEYFDKENNQDVIIDTSYDLNLFSLMIAPYLGITKRFAGQEPYCQITKQYNEGMCSILPLHGIEFVEFPRFSVSEHAVSASIVRECIKNNDHVKIKMLVPQTTYAFLIEKRYLREMNY
jgi:[citrate (pro-3S)-lyase] ligase